MGLVLPRTKSFAAWKLARIQKLHTLMLHRWAFLLSAMWHLLELSCACFVLSRLDVRASQQIVIVSVHITQKKVGGGRKLHTFLENGLLMCGKYCARPSLSKKARPNNNNRHSTTACYVAVNWDLEFSLDVLLLLAVGLQACQNRYALWY